MSPSLDMIRGFLDWRRLIATFSESAAAIRMLDIRDKIWKLPVLQTTFSLLSSDPESPQVGKKHPMFRIANVSVHLRNDESLVSCRV